MIRYALGWSGSISLSVLVNIISFCRSMGCIIVEIGLSKYLYTASRRILIAMLMQNDLSGKIPLRRKTFCNVLHLMTIPYTLRMQPR